MDDEVKKKNTSTSMDDEINEDNLFNLKRLKDGYVSIIDKMGYGKFKPYLQRLFHSVEIMFIHEVTEFKKIDAKYQDMVRQCHIYEKTLSMLKERNSCEMSPFNESSNTYAFDDLTKVTPYLAPDLLQSTLGIGTIAGGSTSLQFRLPSRHSSLSNHQYVSTPLGPTRIMKSSVPLAHFDDDSSLVLTTSLGFQQQVKQFVDVYTQSESPVIIETKDFSCQIIPLYNDKQIETIQFTSEYQSTQTDIILTETIACQINPNLNDCSIQTILNEQKDFSCQYIPNSNDQTTETLITNYNTQIIQTDDISMKDYSCQITPEYIDQQIETIPILTQDIALQSSLNNSTIYDDQYIQTDFIYHNDVSTQYDLDIEDRPDTAILPIIFSEELPISNEIEISIENHHIELEKKIFLDQECQTINNNLYQLNQYTQTSHIYLNDCASQSSIITVKNQYIQTESNMNLYSSSLYIIPTSINQSCCSSKIIILPKENHISSSPIVMDQEIQCNLPSLEISIPISIEHKTNNMDRRSIIQQQLDEKEKQMNKIIEEYAVLYGEYETERRRNMDLTEARDRLADHIKILSDELGDREINQEKLLIKSCQQNKLINYMLPQIDCSPIPKKKHHSATSFRRLLPKFK
ncbi:unnamed protein product [Rotaria sp. Silwood1]|nr:unnamed protein product [Rotaria sp. Silwood1]CAF1270100.1 unnamed protein product [Rotaria sp. Silwood1]CAF3540291.1 unnamed protein product [Rotaria sp. Silwood1]CAF4487146.1 unnamed protein product [Rotaria sp. Silwood1]